MTTDVQGGTAFEALPSGVRAALAHRPTEHRTELAGAGTKWLSWGDPARPPLVFVHGGAAHSWWWSFIAPAFADRFHVVALDLFGHGDSDRLDRYSFARWAEQIQALAGSVSDELPVVIGHSMGGLATAVAARTFDLAGLVIVDSPIGPPANEAVGAADATLARPKVYPTRDIAVSRFRPLPDQPGNRPELVRFIAERSVAPEGDGWGWKFDFNMFARAPEDRPMDLVQTLAAARCPVGIVMGAASEVVRDQDRHDLTAMVAAPGPVISVLQVAGGGHHLMFDRPVELSGAIATTVDRLTGVRP